MLDDLILSIGSLIYLLILVIVYFSKKRHLSIQSKLYHYLLITALILLITEIITNVFFDFNPILAVNNFWLRIHWTTRIIWFLLLYFYGVCVLKDLEYKNIFDLIKNNYRCLVAFLVTIIFFTSYMFVPFKDMTKETFTYLPGAAAYYVLSYCTLLVVVIMLYLILQARDTTKRKKASMIILCVEMIIILIFQFIFPNAAVLGLGIALQMYFLYFYNENPDLFAISELEKVKDTIVKANTAKSDFLSNMSHEIRTPMNAIVGFSDTILNDSTFDEAKVRSDINHILSAGNNLLDIINNILDISKIESGSYTLEEKEYSIAAVILELTSIIEARLNNRPIELITDIDALTPSKLYGDQTKIFQVLLNILTNAVKYTEVGKIKLSLVSEINMDTVKLKFQISDTGYGIKKEDYNKLFEKFTRLDSATTNEIEGTGLGLVITKKYVDLMGGKIRFESEYGVGTTFFVEISQKIVSNTAIGDIREPYKTSNVIENYDCSNYKVMIVDDNKLNLKVAERILKSYKFNVELVTSGKDCIYKVKEGRKYDMIFLDHMMPEMDGIEVVHILKKLVDYNIPPIVALTANAITGMREMYLREGFDEYLSKPININDLNKLIEKYFVKDDHNNPL